MPNLVDVLQDALSLDLDDRAALAEQLLASLDQPNGAPCHAEQRHIEGQRLTIVYWKADRFWLGKLLEHPEIMTQGETVDELEDNLREAYRLMVLDDVPDEHQIKSLAL